MSEDKAQPKSHGPLSPAALEAIELRNLERLRQELAQDIAEGRLVVPPKAEPGGGADDRTPDGESLG
jgi:hypothetical protein